MGPFIAVEAAYIAIKHSSIDSPLSKVLPKLTSPQLVKKNSPNFMDPNVHYHQINPIRAPPSHFSKIRFNILPSMSGSSRWSLSPLKPCLSFRPMLATCSAHLSLDLATNIIYGEEYRALSFLYSSTLLVPLALRPKYPPLHPILKHP
jgi:hypothetical protein